MKTQTREASHQVMTNPSQVLMSSQFKAIYPLSTLQHSLIYYYQVSKFAQVNTTTVIINGEYNVDLFYRAIDRVVNIHDILRIHVELEKYSDLMQVVNYAIQFAVTVENIEKLSLVAQQTYLTNWLKQETKREFIWNDPPLFRSYIHILGNKKFSFTLIDPWLDKQSSFVVISDILKIYTQLINDQRPNVHTPKFHYFDYISHQKLIESDEKSLRFWLDYIQQDEHNSKLLIAPTIEDRHKHEKSTLQATIVFETPLLDSLNKIASEIKVSLKHVLLAAHVYIMRVLSVDKTIITGLMIDTRPDFDNWSQTVGIFSNLLPFKISLENNTWEELIKLVYKTEEEILPYKYSSLNKIRELSQSEIFSTLFNFISYHAYADLFRNEKINIQEIYCNSLKYFDLTANFSLDICGELLKLELDINHIDITREFASRIGEYYKYVLQAISKNSKALCGDTLLLTKNEQSVLSTINQTDSYFGEKHTIHQIFEQIANNNRDNIAIVYNELTFTYAWLLEKRDQLAYMLSQKMGITQGAYIGVCLNQSVDYIVSVLAVLALQAVCVPIKASFPSEYINQIINKLNIKVVIANDLHFPLNQCQIAQVYYSDLDKVTMSYPEPLSIDSDAFIMFTSGSQGNPKGVKISHASLYNRFNWMWGSYPYLENEIQCFKAPINFIDSLWEMFGALLIGKPTVILDNSLVYNLSELVAVLKKKNVTRITFVPTLLNEIVNYCESENIQLDSLLLGIVSGESFPVATALKFKAIAPHAKILNLYGSTEVMGDVLAYEVNGKENGKTIPIGKPIANTKVCITDNQLTPLPFGVIGEIVVSGENLSLGYIDSADSQYKFIANSACKYLGKRVYRTGDAGFMQDDGTIHIIGRIDRQIKIRGIRIEPAEIEYFIEQLPNVSKAAVAVSKNANHSPILVAFIKLKENHEIDAMKLNDDLKNSLPPEKIPTLYVKINEFPLTNSGKIDYKKLADVDLSIYKKNSANSNRQLNIIEKKLLTIWQELLNQEDISVTEKFLDLGADSIMSIKLISRIKQNFHVNISINTIFDNLSIEQLAKLIEVELKKVVKQINA